LKDNIQEICGREGGERLLFSWMGLLVEEGRGQGEEGAVVKSLRVMIVQK